jgi:hypothetical protein
MKDYISKSNELYCQGGKLSPDWNGEEYLNWIVSDVRFPNEAQAIKDHGGIVVAVQRTICPKCGEVDNFHFDYITHVVEYCNECGHRWDTHASETSLDGYKFDWVIENDSNIETLI